MRRGRRHVTAAILATAAMAAVAGPAAPAQAKVRPGDLRAGVGQADITPPKTGYYLGGFTRQDRLALGQSTRIYANAVVLQRGTRKVALVAAELFAIPAGLQEDVARAVASLGYDEQTVVLAASHTHSGPGGYFNNPTYNFAAPSTETITDPSSFVKLFVQPPADRQLYTFLVGQIALAIRRADRDRAPAVAGWGHGDLDGITQNRSIEAHLADHGIHVALGVGTPQMDPKGPLDTIDPAVDVLRVDKLRRVDGRTRRVPIGAWTNFADHGTVIPAIWEAYSGDHHAYAWRKLTQLIRAAGHVPDDQAVVAVYPNSNEGDITAGIQHHGPSGADQVGTAEAHAMFAAWRRAGRALSRRPALDLRWTRTCFCGRETATGPVASRPEEGLPFLTGSEEERGPLFDLTGVPFEGTTSPFDDPVQGDKVAVPLGDPPPAVPITLLRVGDWAIGALPGEATKEAGARMKAAVLDALRPAGVRGVVIAGLADDYVQYVTTPEEYQWQAYEGGSTVYGRNEATFFQERLVDLAARLRDGAPAPAPYPFDASYGVHPDGPAYGRGAASGTVAVQPARSADRLQHVRFAWDGGPAGEDRPVDAAFVTAQRRLPDGSWHDEDSDLGMNMLWRVDAHGRYDLTWEVPLTIATGTYRFVVTASRYRLTSDAFQVEPSRELAVEPVPDGPGRVAVRLTYPPADPAHDLTSRPSRAVGGTVDFRVNGVTRRVRHVEGSTFRLAAPSGTTVTIAPGAAADRAGNTTRRPVELHVP